MVQYPLGRLQNSVSRFIVPSAAPWDVQTLKAQIELRRHALTDIEIIRTRLRLSKDCAVKSVQRRKRRGRTGQSHATKVLRSRANARPV
jgi:hypothetical protein